MDQRDLGRRPRLTSTPSGKTIRVHDGDVAIIEALQRHGYLNTFQIFQLVYPIFTNYTALGTRLTNLYHEPSVRYGGTLLIRPGQQKDNDRRRSALSIYAKSIYADELLKERSLYQPQATVPSGPFLHQVFSSYMSASLEIAARQIKGMTFVPQYAYLKSGDLSIPIELDGKTTLLRPDGVCGLEFNSKRLNIFREEDRSTEPHERPDLDKPNRKYTKLNIRQYQKLIGQGFYKEHFNLRSGAIVLYTTTRYGRRDSVVKFVHAHFPRGCNYMLHHAVPGFSALTELPDMVPAFDIQWKRAGNPDCTILDFFRQKK